MAERHRRSAPSLKTLGRSGPTERSWSAGSHGRGARGGDPRPYAVRPQEPAATPMLPPGLLRFVRPSVRLRVERWVENVGAPRHGIRVSATTIATALRAHHPGPAPRRGPTWRECLIHQASGIIARDFLTAETVWLRTLYVLFFVELGTRRVQVAGATRNPDSAWVTQQARNVAGALEEQGTSPRFLIHDRDTKFSGSFDTVFKADGPGSSARRSRPERERLRREVGGNRSGVVSGLDADPRTPPPATGPSDLRPAFQRPPASPGPEPEGAGMSRPAKLPSTTWPGATAIRYRRTHQ